MIGIVRWILLAPVLLALPLASAQDKTGLSHSRPSANSQVGGGPVTQAEAAVVFQKAEKVMRTVLGSKSGSRSALGAGKSPVTRAEILREMDRLFGMAKPSFKFTPPQVKYDEKLFSAKDAATKARLRKLVGWGFVAKVGPLATGQKEGLTVKQFGDAVGFFLLRVSDLTHLPSTKWSPYLQPAD